MAKKVGRAVDEFDRLYNATISDGIIDKSEAQVLVQYHNELQRLSRQELTLRLREYGHHDEADRLDKTTLIGEMINKQADYTVWPDNAEIEIVRGLPDSMFFPYTDWRPGQKTKFFMITGPPIIITALHILGVF